MKTGEWFKDRMDYNLKNCCNPCLGVSLRHSCKVQKEHNAVSLRISGKLNQWSCRPSWRNSYLRRNWLLWKPLALIRLCIKFITAWVKQLLITASSDSKPGNRCCSTCRVYPRRVIIRQEGFGECGSAFTATSLLVHSLSSFFSFTTYVPSTLLYFTPLSPCSPSPLPAVFPSLSSSNKIKPVWSPAPKKKQHQPPLCHQKHLSGCHGYSLGYNYYSNAVFQSHWEEVAQQESRWRCTEHTRRMYSHSAVSCQSVKEQWMRSLYITSLVT